MRTDTALPSEAMTNPVNGLRALPTDHLILLIAVAASRWIFRSHTLYMMDSVNFALGMQHFAPVLHQPHPPGYYLYVKLAQLVQHLLPNPNDALVAISIAASCLAAALIYQLAYVWFGRNAARWAGALFVFSPLAWFHGTVALVYIAEAGMAALIGYLCWLAYCGKREMVIVAAIAFGLAAGIRQSTALFLSPLLLLALRQAGWRYALIAIGAGALTVAAWFLPMLAESGGYAAYFTALDDLWSRVPATQSVFRQPAMIFPHALFLTAAYGLCFAAAAPLLFVRGIRTSPPPGAWLFLAAWLAPGMLFFVFIFLHPLALGYVLFLFVPLFALLGAKVAALPVMAKGGRKRSLLILALAAVHAAIFLFVPLYTSHAAITQYEQDLPRVERGLRAVATPEKTIVVAFDAHFYGFRHIGYGLPEYLVVSYPELRFSQGAGIFAMHARSTEILGKLPLEQYERFVLYFPNARDAEVYRHHLPSLFTTGNVSFLNVDGHEFLTGPASALDRIFPAPAHVDQEAHIQYHLPEADLNPDETRMPTAITKIR